MDNNKNPALAALIDGANQVDGANRLIPWTTEQLVDAVKQEYNTHRKQAELEREFGHFGNARSHHEAAATLADLLCRYYQTTNATVAEEWAHRATRFHARARQTRNEIADRIGASGES